MKVTIEVEIDDLSYLTKVLAGHNGHAFVTTSRLSLVKEIHDLAKRCVDRGTYPSLTESKEAIWKHTKMG